FKSTKSLVKEFEFGFNPPPVLEAVRSSDESADLEAGKLPPTWFAHYHHQRSSYTVSFHGHILQYCVQKIRG
ncbi:hypothetical protein AVEN_252728-1, partial [Araneus ventricosus]